MHAKNGISVEANAIRKSCHAVPRPAILRVITRLNVMKKLPVSILLTLLCINETPAGTLPSPLMETQIGVASAFGGIPPSGAVVDPSGNLVVAFRGSVGKISSAGTLLWQKDGYNNGAAALAVDGAGNSYVAGAVSQVQFRITKLAPNGDFLWSRDRGQGAATHVVLDDQGGIYASGYSTSTSQDLFLVKYDAAGVEQWTRRFNGSADLADAATGLVAMPGGGVVVTGITRNTAEQFITIRYTLSGSSQWVDYYDEPAETEGPPVGIVRTSDGGVAIAGLSGRWTIATLKYSAAGVRMWANRTLLPSVQTTWLDATPQGIVAGPGGGAVVLGSTYARDSLPEMDYTLFSVSGTGGTDWSSVIRSIPENYTGAAALIALPGGGYFAAAGESRYTSSYTGIHAKLTCVNAGGSGLTHVDWPNPLATSYITCRTLVAGHDGSVWAVAGDTGTLFVKRFGAVPSAGVPVAVTSGFDNLLTTSVRLKGTVNPCGSVTSYYYDFGPTSSYGTSTPQRSLPAGTAMVDAFEPGVGVTPGATYHFRLVATNAAGTAYGLDEVFTVPQSAYQMWTVAAFGSLAAPGSGPTDDPDFDGLQNLVEYTFGGSATVAGQPIGLPVMEMWTSPDSGIVFPSIVYRPDPTRTDITIIPVVSNNLTSWSTSGVVVMNLADGRRRAVAQGFQHFMRLQITSP